MFGGLLTAQTAIPAALAVISALISFLSINGRRGRLRKQVKDSIEISKLAGDAESATVKERADALALAQIERLNAFDARAANRQYDKPSLGVAIVLLVAGAPAVWALFLSGWIVTTVLAWIVVGFLVIFVPTGIVMFFLGGTRQSQANEG